LQIVNGRNVVRFDGSNDQMGHMYAADKPHPMSMVNVARISATSSSTQYVFNGADSTHVQGMYVSGSGSGSKWALISGATTLVSTVTNDTAKYHLIVSVFDGAASKIRVNGVQTTGTLDATQAANGRRFSSNTGGTTSRMTGDIVEHVEIGHALTAGEIADLEAYFQPLVNALNGV
jgi:hypothetical protein